MNVLNPDHLPLLGECGPVELANSLYVFGREQLDFLEGEWGGLWLEHAEGMKGVEVSELGELRALRAVVREVISCAWEPERVPAEASLARLKAWASNVRPRLEWSRGRPALELEWEGDWGRRVLGRLAYETIALAAGQDWERLRVCAADDCPMWFVGQHGRRRFCHATCSGRMRQAAYMRRGREGREGRDDEA